MPAYKVPNGMAVLFARRGDIVNDDPDTVGQRDGMVGFLDPADWFGAEIWLSEFTQKRMFIGIIPRGPIVAALKTGIIGGVDSAGHTIPGTMYLDYASFTSLKTMDGDTISNPESIIHSPEINPIWDLRPLSGSILKDASDVDWKNVPAIPDFHAVTTGSYTIGSGAQDYPTFNGAGGFLPDINVPLTGNLTGTLETAVTENATTTFSKAHSTAHTILLTSDTPHNGDPTAGHLITVTSAGACFRIEFYVNIADPGGGFEIENMTMKRTANATDMVKFSANPPSYGYGLLMLHDCLVDGNGNGTYGLIATGTPKIHVYNNVFWDCTTGIYVQNSGGLHNALVQNNVTFDCTHGMNLTSTGAIFADNNMSWGNTNPYINIDGADGENNIGDDASNADGNWSTGSGNLVSKTILDNVTTTTDTNSDFMNIVASSDSDGGGITNTIAARTTGIRGNVVPGPNGTSIGVAEAIAAAGGFFPIFNAMQTQGAF